MRSLRDIGTRTLIFTCVAALAGVWASAALADRPIGLEQSTSSRHFVVHFTTTGVNAVNAPDVAVLIAAAERAYDLEVGQWGWPAPPDDGDGKTDIYLLHIDSSEAGYAAPDSPGSRVTAYIGYGSQSVSRPNDVLIAHEFLHVLEMGRSTIPLENTFLTEGMAYWASWRAVGGDTTVPWRMQTRASLDCATAAACHQPDGDGQPWKWTFFEYLAERFGPSVIREIWDDASTLGPGFDPLTALDRTLVRHGAGLGSIWNDYATATLWNDFTIDSLKQHPMNPLTRTVVAGQPLTVTVDHLDMEYVAIRGTDAKACLKGSLRVSVAFPAGIGAKPALTRSIGETLNERPTRLTGDASDSSAVVPWWSCHDVGTLVLPNPSRQDGVTFTVTAHFTPPTTCLVPSVKGLTSEEARNVLNEAGCALGGQVRVASPPSFKRRVVSQKPRAGTKVPGGTRVTIYVGNGKRRRKP